MCTEYGSTEEIISEVSTCLHRINKLLDRAETLLDQLKATEETENDEIWVVELNTDGDFSMYSLREFLENYNYFEDLSMATAMEGRLCIRCKENDIISQEEHVYLNGPAYIFNIDEDGNYCPLSRQTICDLLKFEEEYKMVIHMDGKDGNNYEAFYLD